MNPSPAPALPSVPEPLQRPRRPRPGCPLGLEPLRRRHLEAARTRGVGADAQPLAHPADRSRQTTLEEFARDEEFVGLLRRHVDERAQTLAAPSWYAEHCQKLPASTHRLPRCWARSPTSAWSSASARLCPSTAAAWASWPGDFLKAASDLGVPVVGVGILWQQGYFRQALNAAGSRSSSSPSTIPASCPSRPSATPTASG